MRWLFYLQQTVHLINFVVGVLLVLQQMNEHLELVIELIRTVTVLA